MPTRFPGGITNSRPNTALENLLYPNPFLSGDIILKGDSLSNLALTSPATWTVTTVGTGTRVVTNTNAAYGALTLTNSAADNDSICIQSKFKAAITDSTKRIIFAARPQMNSVNSDVLLGITNTTTTPIGGAGTEETGVTDGIFFLRVTTESTWRFYIRSGNATVASATGLGSSASGSFRNLHFEYVPTTKRVKVWINDVQVTSLSASTFPATDLYAQICVQNGDGNARNMNVEYLLTSQER